MMKKVLIVDDEADICNIVKYNLECEGYYVETASSSEDALRKNLYAFNLFIFDVMMGEISGFQLASTDRAWDIIWIPDKYRTINGN